MSASTSSTAIRSGRAARPVAARRAASTGVLRATAAALLLVALGVFHIWSRTRVLDSGYALGELERQHDRLSREHDRLVVLVERLRSPDELERYARTHLGMAPPAPGTVWAAGPRLAAADHQAGGDGVGHRRDGPAEPLLAARSAAPQISPLSTASGGGGGWGVRRAAGARDVAADARDAVVPGEIASRGLLRAGRLARREPR